MRRLVSTILVTAATFAPAASVNAQSIGFKLGASISTLSVSDDENSAIKSTTNFGGGGFIRFGMGNLGIQLELLSLTKGADVDAPGDDDINFRFEYVEVPVLLHLPLTSGSSFAPYVFGGPTIGLEIGCEAQVPGNAAVDCDDDAADIFERKKTDFGLAVGGGLAFAMGPGALLVEGRYTFGLTGISESESSPDIKNRSAFIAAGYSIPLNR
jgi:hypothetical protein